MMDGIIDMLETSRSMVFSDEFMPDTDENGKIIQSKKQAGEYIKRFKKCVQDGEILRFSMFCQRSLAKYKGFDDYINKKRREEVDRLNEKYYGKEKYLKIKQCM
jgi:hypothetical protein